jgi:hypothetical protein
LALRLVPWFWFSMSKAVSLISARLFFKKLLATDAFQKAYFGIKSICTAGINGVVDVVVYQAPHGR